ncbi:MAG: hypothetical protein JKY19_12070 [Alcanivoracaceae bacterium]|nr:hypothetical protein [Alcanivoracaceae bacterium]
MNYQTLHLCNLDEIKNISSYSQLVTIEDAVIFYGETMNNNQYKYLIDLFSGYNCYFITSDDDMIATISHNNWVELVNKYRRTFTWK